MLAVVEDPAVIVKAEVPAPGATIEVGLNEAVVPLGKPVTVKATAELKPPDLVVTTLAVSAVPWARVVEFDCELGNNAAIVKSPDTTVRVTVAVCVFPLPVPVMVIVYDPTVVVEPTLNVTVEMPDPGAGIDVGRKEAVVPEGNPDAVNATAALNPPINAVVIVVVPEPLVVTVIGVGEAVIVKSELLTVRLMVVVLVFPPPVPVTTML